MKNELDTAHAGYELLNMRYVAEYLTKNGWYEKKNAGRGLVAVYERRDNRLIQAAFPATDEVDDRSLVISRGVAVVAAQERRSPEAVFLDLLFYSDDVLELREITAESNNGTIPLQRASDM